MSSPDHTGQRWRKPYRPGSVALMLLVAVTAAFSLASAATAADPISKIDPAVIADVADGQADFWAILTEQADLEKAPSIQNRTARGAYVVDQLKEVADEAQGGLLALLTKQGIHHRSFWIVNAIKIRAAGQGTLLQVAAQPEVAKIVAPRVYQVPQPTPGTTEAEVDAVEWGIANINADDVWAQFGDRGEGIVVANIDTGVQYNHPALVRQYRGNLGGGNFDHNYNWFDPSNVCGNPSLVPCDNNNHGTHTMGTMVGDDGDPGANQIGVAPHARWIAAKGCETNFCSDAALLASGQWILAPTDLNGQNPRPDLRPDIVNNSWGGGPGDPWYQPTVDAWIASGIFPQFSNGNAGPACGTAGSPGDYPQSYSAGAYDINNVIASFSSRGPSAFGGEVKPNIAAPGVNVRSSIPGGYGIFNGTSMASPHVAGTVALMWSRAPVLVGDIATTRTLLDDTAVDTPNAQCGGTDDDNNVFGEGRLDALAAVSASPAQAGTLTGTVTNAANGNPIAGVTIHAVGPADRTTTTNAAGQYSFVIAIGTYDVTASAFGFVTQTASGVVVTEGATTTQNFALAQVPTHQVSGHVRDSDGNPLANATVEIVDTPIPPVTTNASGFYSFPSVPEGTYQVRAEAGRCNDPQQQSLVVDGDETLDFTLPLRTDSFGYSCVIVAPSYIEASTVLPLTGDDAAAAVNLPFTFRLYGQPYTTAFVATNGHLNFLAANTSFSNGSIPSTAAPNAAIYPFWDDLLVDGSSSVRTELLGAAPNRRFVIEWRNVTFFGDTTRRLDFEVVLHEDGGAILTQYRNVADDGREMGNSATLGIENQAGTVALQYSFNEAVVASPEFAVLYQLLPKYEQGVDVGSNAPYVDTTGDSWAPDQQYSAGSWGYTVRGNLATTNGPIDGTSDDTLYRTARRGQTEYRFDGLPVGKYEVQLRFAEIQNRKPGQRLFDVTVEGNVVLFGFDIAGEVGQNAADDKSFIVSVNDGQLNVRFILRQADKEPIINALRVTHRPDM